MNTFDLRLDLDKGRTPGQVVRIRQGDQDGTTIRATIYDHGTALSDTVTACAIVMKLPDGTHYYRKGASWADGTTTVTIDERQAASVVGRTVLAYFTLTVGTVQYSTGSFAVVVEPDAVGDAELPEDYDTAIQDAIDRCNAAAAALEGALPIGTANLANGAVTADKLADAVRKGYVRSFETVAAMQAATDLKAGMTCHTNGFHASGDGGAAYYTVSASGTANGMDVLALQSGLFATLVVTEPYVTPEQFGAYGDGTHDDCTYIQRSIDYLDGGTVQLLAEKTYLCSNTIVLHRGIRLYGSAPYDGTGRGSVIKLADGANRPLVQTPMAASGSSANATHFMMIENLYLDGNAANQTIEANLVEFYGAYIGSIIRNVHISSCYGSALVLDSVDIQIDNVWISYVYSDEGRYAMDMNPTLAESTRTSMINVNNLYIEQVCNVKSGNPATNPEQRGNALHIYKCASFNANEIHFEACLTPITIENAWNVLLTNASVGVAGYSDDNDSNVVRVKTLPRLLDIRGLAITSTSYYTYWINTDVAGNVVQPVAIKSGFSVLPYYLIMDSPSASSPIIQNPVFPNNATVEKYGSSSGASYILKYSDAWESRFKLNGEYTELGTSIRQQSFKTFLRIISSGGASDRIEIFTPISLGERDSAASVSAGSIYRYTDARGTAPTYQRTTGLASTADKIVTARMLTAAPTESAAYVGEMAIDYSNKKVYIATSIGSGASDWSTLI